MTMKVRKKPRWSYSQFERKIFPEWLFHPEYEELRRVFVITYPIVLISVVTLIFWGSLSLAWHENILGLVTLSFALFLVVLVQYGRRSKVHSDVVIVLGVMSFGFFVSIFSFSVGLAGLSFFGRISSRWWPSPSWAHVGA